MNVPVTWLTRRAVMLLDEDMEEIVAAEVFGDPGMELSRLVGELVPEGASKTMREADFGDIDETLSLCGGKKVMAAASRLELKVPDDFMRLVEFRMSDWPRSLTDWREPQAVMHGYSLPGLRLENRPDGRYLIADGTKAGATVVSAQYLPLAEVKDDGHDRTVWIPRSLVNRTAWTIATMAREIITT